MKNCFFLPTHLSRLRSPNLLFDVFCIEKLSRSFKSHHWTARCHCLILSSQLECQGSSIIHLGIHRIGKFISIICSSSSRRDGNRLRGMLKLRESNVLWLMLTRRHLNSRSNGHVVVSAHCRFRRRNIFGNFICCRGTDNGRKQRCLGMSGRYWKQFRYNLIVGHGYYNIGLV